VVAACFIAILNVGRLSQTVLCPGLSLGGTFDAAWLLQHACRAIVGFHGKRKVKMGQIEQVAFNFMVGLTACGLAGSAMELIAGRRLAFVEPYVSPAHMLRSLAVTACAGPLMFTNDALDAWRDGRISRLALISCGCTATIWALALGVAVSDIASRAGTLLGSAHIPA
jgi:hypothetical protein